MTTLRKIRALRPLAGTLALLAGVLVLSAALRWQGPSGSFATGIQALVPWAVGIIGVLCLYMLRLARDIEKDFTAVKASHSEQLETHRKDLDHLRVEHERDIATARADFTRELGEARADTRVLVERVSALGESVEGKVTGSRHKVVEDIDRVIRAETLERHKVDDDLLARVRFLEQQHMALPRSSA